MMIFNAVSTKDKSSLSHHGVKGQKWGVLNPETKFKYGLTDISPAAAAAGGGSIDTDFRQYLREALAKGEISQAEYTAKLMEHLINDAKNKNREQGESIQSIDADKTTEEEHTDPVDENAPTDPVNENAFEEGVENVEEMKPTGSRNYLQEALARAKEKKEKDQEEEKEKERKKNQQGQKSSGSSGSSNSSGSRNNTKKHERNKSKKKAKKTKSNSKDNVIDVDEGPGQYVKDPFWKRENLKKGRLIKMQRSRTGRGPSTPTVKKVKGDRRRVVYHSDIVDDLVEGYFNER